MGSRLAATALALVAVAACGSRAPGGGPAPPPGPAGGGPEVIAPRVLDEGTFRLSMQGQPIGSERFVIRQATGITVEHEGRMSIGAIEVVSSGALSVDEAWRPRGGAFRGSVGGAPVDAELLAGPPVTLRATVGGRTQEVAAPGDIDLFIADNVMSHFAPLCAVPAEGATRTAFPAVAIRVAPPTPTAAPGVSHVAADLGGAAAVDLYCEGNRLLAVELPMQSFVAVREGAEEVVASVRRVERSKPELPEGLVELPRRVEVPAGKGIEGVTLDCSLLVPASHAEVRKRGTPRPLPAAVFITGSGPQDRDSDSYGLGGLKLSIFKVMAIELGQAGIASLRCDDRGTGGSTGNLVQATLQAFVADAAAAVAALRREPAIDPARIALIGHSEGGVVAPLVALADRKVRALVLMAGTGRPLDVIILEQVERAVRTTGLGADHVEGELARTRAVFEALRRDAPLPDDVPPAAARQWEASRAWMRSHLAHDPAATARKLGRVAVLIAQGDKDQQVAVADAEVLRDAFARARNQQVEYRIYPGLNHLFARSATGDISEYSSPEAAVDAGFLADVVDFLRRRL
jgi:alpha-beta hydrolase superfamily lysophospholipase